MPQNLKFPPSVEIKRAIAAVKRSGICIRSIEIHPRRIVIVAKDPADDEPKHITYADWKTAQCDKKEYQNATSVN